MNINKQLDDFLHATVDKLLGEAVKHIIPQTYEYHLWREMRISLFDQLRAQVYTMIEVALIQELVRELVE